MRRDNRMNKVILILLTTFASRGVALAQAPAPAKGSDATKGYVEGVAQSAFGQATSQSYGGELGFTLMNNLQVFVEGGKTRNVAGPALGDTAQAIAGYLTTSQSGSVSYSVKQPVAFGDAGVRYLIPTSIAKVEPYVLGGFGFARVSQDVHFFVAGTDVTSSLDQFRVVLGSDLSGDVTKPLMMLGGGIAWPVWQHIVIDFQYRYGRIFNADDSVNLSRAGIGLGVRF
jgi:opacity protein-like surface antigen